MAATESITSISIKGKLEWVCRETRSGVMLLEDAESSLSFAGTKDQLQDMLFRMMEAINSQAPATGRHEIGIQHGQV